MRQALTKIKTQKILRQQLALQSTGNTTRTAASIQKLVDKAPTAIFIFQGMKNVLVNAAAEKLTGYSRQELLQLKFWNIIHPDFRLMVRQRGVTGQRGVKSPTRYDVKIVRKDGGERWLDYSGAVITWRGKAAVMGTAVDITDKKDAERDLRRRLNQLEALHETVLAASANLDLNTVLNVVLEKIDLFLGLQMVAVIRVRDNETGAPHAMALRNISEQTWLELVPRGGSALIRAVLETKTPVVVTDASRDHRVRCADLFRRLGLVSYIGLPLAIGDRVIGDIGIFIKKKHEFTGEEITFISTLANQAAIAIRNSLLYEQMKRRTDELAALNAVTHAITRSHDLNTVLNEAVQAMARIAYFDGARIYLFSEDANEAHLEATFDSAPRSSWSLVKTVPRGVGIIGRVAQTGEPAIFEDVQTDLRYQEMSHTRGARNANGRFFAVFPIQTREKTWGAMSCMAQEPRRLNTEEIDLMVAMCDHVAVVIENASLFQSTAEKAKKLSTLFAVVGDCMRFLDINSLLYQCMRRILDVFGFTAGRVYLCDENPDELRLITQEGFRKNVVSRQGYSLGEGLIGLVAQKGECLCFEDMQNDPEYERLAREKILLRAGYRGSFFIPLKGRGGTIGVMNFVSENAHPFSSADIELINAIAYHVGIAIGNANIFSRLKRQSVELEKANKAKSEFLGVISHELRTPLNVILGYAELMKQNMIGELTLQGQAVVSKMAGQAKKLSSLLESILVTTNIEAGVVEVAATELNLAEWFIQLRSFYETLDEKVVQLIWDIPIDLPVIKTDVMKLQRILQNLIDNSIKFTDEGSVTVSARILNDEGKVNFIVRDTGVGIAQKDIPRIFDMFSQVDGSTTRTHEGVGLGLYIVRKLTELLHGTVEVRSELGKGSAFTVSFRLNN